VVFLFQIAALLAIVACGAFARRRFLTDAGVREIARLATDVAYPALVFDSVLAFSASDLAANALLPLAAVAVALVGLLPAAVCLPLFLRRAPSATRRAFAFQCLINNYLFLPLPIVASLYGPRGVALLVFASLGFEIVLWSLGVSLFAARPGWRSLAAALASPPFVALLLGLLYVLLRPVLPLPASPVAVAARSAARGALSLLRAATVPMAMMVAGARFATMPLPTLRLPSVWLAVFLRLLLIPLLALPLLRLFPLPSDARAILAIVATMPCALVSSLLCERHGGDAPFISGTLLLSHLLAVPTVPLLLSLFA